MAFDNYVGSHFLFYPISFGLEIHRYEVRISQSILKSIYYNKKEIRLNILSGLML